MEPQIDGGEAEVAHEGAHRAEAARRDHAFLDRGRDGLARLDVPADPVEHLWLPGEALHQHRGELDEVPRHARARGPADRDFGGHVVEQVAGLVEQPRHLHVAQQGRATLARRRRDVGGDDGDAGQLALLREPVDERPSPLPLGFTREEVEIEEAGPALLVVDLPLERALERM